MQKDQHQRKIVGLCTSRNALDANLATVNPLILLEMPNFNNQLCFI